MAALFFIMIMFAGIIVFALDGYGSAYERESFIYIDVDNYGNVNISLPSYYYEIERNNGIITITLRNIRDDLAINLPTGWVYSIAGEHKNCPNENYPAEDYEILAHEFITISNFYNNDEYSFILGDAPGEYGYIYEHDVIVITITPSMEEGGPAFDYAGEIGQAPIYTIVPFGETHTVTFNSNGGYAMPVGHGSRTTLPNGTVGPGNMPTVPQWPGGGRAVIGWNFESDYSGAAFDHNTVIDQDVTVYAVWGFLVHFSGNGTLLNIYAPDPISPNYPEPGFPDSPTCYSTRGIPVSGVSWSFDSTPWVVFPDPPVRPGWSFQGWFDTPDPIGGNLFHASSPITAEVVLSARWELVRWIVTFEPEGGILQDGWIGSPQRSYRWALDTLSVWESSTDESIGSFIPLAPAYRQNQFRPHNPAVPRAHLEYTPYFTGSGTSIINPVPTDGQLADTAWPLSAPSVRWDDLWVPPTAAGHPEHTSIPRRTISGWWESPGGWESNWTAPAAPPSFIVTTAPPAPPALVNPRWAMPGFSNSTTSSFPPSDHGFAYRPVTADTTVYAHYVYRITFDPNGGTAGSQDIIVGSWTNLYPGGSSVTNFRDVLPGGPRTINNDGRRTLNSDVHVQIENIWTQYLWAYAGMSVPAGMPPPASMSRVGHSFNGWWCTQLVASSDSNFPITQNATEFTGDSIINCPCPGTSVAECAHFPWKGGSRNVWAHWLVLPIIGSTIHFNLNVPQTGEFINGHAFWPTFRPDNLQGAFTDRYFLSRTPIAGLDIDDWYEETPLNNAHMERLAPWHVGLSVFGFLPANVHYDDRLAMQITRHYVAGRSVNSTEPSILRMPRNPMRLGYVFMGWYDNPQGTGPRFTGNEVLDPGARTLYAQWAPSFDIIFNYNDGTGREMVREMAIGYSFGGWDGDGDSMRAMGRWNNENIFNASGQAHVPHHLDLSWALPHALLWVRGSAWIPIPSTSMSFNFYQNPDSTNHFQLHDQLQITQDILDQYGGINNGRRYVRVYQQWGITLTFNNNLAMIGSGLFAANRPATIAQGQSVNMSLNAATRHPHLPYRESVFSPWTAVSPWLGTTGVHGTVGGWPANTPATPVGGHWPEIFQLAGPAWNLLEWNTEEDGAGTEITPDTIFNEPLTIHAIWGQYLVFHPGLAGAAAQNMPDPLRRPVIVNPPSTLAGFPATPPTWEGRTFRGWHAWGDPAAPQLTASTPVAIARTYHAVWYADVTWHPAFPANAITGAQIPNYPVNTGTTARRVIIGNPFGAVGPGDPTRPGDWVLGRDTITNEVNWFAVDANAPNGRRMYNRVAPPIMQATVLHAEWWGNVHFLLNGGRINNSTATVSRLVREGLTLASNPVAERTPPNPERENAIFAGWRQVHENGNPVIPGSAPLTTAQVEAIAVNSDNIWFEAIWSLNFGFFKSDMSVYGANPEDFNRRQGATFVLERPDSAGGWNTVFTATSDANGRVAMTGAYSALSEIPSTTGTAVIFRIRETIAPVGYTLPSSHWYMAIGGAGGLVMPVPATVASPATPNLDFVVVAYTDEDGDISDIWVVGNRPVTFEFTKVNQLNQPLPGAEFQLLIFNGEGTPPLEMFNTSNIPANWSVVPAKSSAGAVIVFPMIPGRFYQLIETRAPSGFQLPMGQWRIFVENVTPPANPTLTITAVGGLPMPPITATNPLTYNILNIPAITLPLAGGDGALTFVVAGSSVLLVALLGIGFMMLHRRKQAAVG